MQNLQLHSQEDARFHILGEVIQQITSINVLVIRDSVDNLSGSC